MKDSTIIGILANKVYKGVFIHGKRGKHPTHYKNVVDLIVSECLWEEYQVQRHK